ncbi:MAG: Spy/CpxP family protein refolding chaperone [Gammaproteobacteria bacterium]|jgi:Spy/CpxP family protein refolding chaperone
MRNQITLKTTGKSLFGLLLVLLSATVSAQSGMMRHMDDEDYQNMMQNRGYGGYGYGYGYGRGGYGRHMGPMMGGPMMGGPMMGQMMGGMMGPMMMGNLAGLDLSKKQRDQIRDIYRQTRKEHWDAMEKAIEASDKLYDLYDTDKPDPDKIGKVYDEMYKYKRQMIEQRIKSRNKIFDLLNKEQQEKFRDYNSFRRGFGMGMMMP